MRVNANKPLDALFDTAMKEFIGLWPLEGLDGRIRRNLRERQFSLTDRPNGDEEGGSHSSYYLDNANFNLYEYRVPDLVLSLFRRTDVEKTLFGYQNLGGRQDVKESLARLARLRSGRLDDPGLTPWNVFVGNGATSLLEKTFQSVLLLCPGKDEIVFHKPVYPVIPFLILKSGGRPVAIDTTPERKFLPTLREIEKVITRRTAALCLVYPCNPSGTTFTDQDELREIFAFAKKQGIFLIVDEVYQDTTHSAFKHISSLGLADSMKDFVTVTSLSKDRPGFNDLRLGYAVGDPRLVTVLHLLTSGQEWQPPTFCQDLLLFDTNLRIARMTGARSLRVPHLDRTVTGGELDGYFRQVDDASAKIERHVGVLYRVLRSAEAVERILAPEAGNILFFKLRSSWYRRRANDISDFLRRESVYVRPGRFFLAEPDDNWFRITVTQPLDYMLSGVHALLGSSPARRKKASVEPLRREIAHEPGNGRLLTSYACGLLNVARYREALKILDRVVVKSDILTRYRTFYLRGACLLGLKRFPEAVRALKKAVRIPVERKKSWFEGTTVDEDYYHEQLSTYGKAWLYYNLGVVCSFLKQTVRSQRYLAKARRSGYDRGESTGDVLERRDRTAAPGSRVVFCIDTQLKPNRWYEKIYVADSSRNGETVRSMHFGSPEFVPESAYIPRKPDFIVKNSNLPCIFALGFLKKRANRFLIIGLGGGTLAKLIRKYFPASSIDVVEIDRAVLTAAHRMGFHEGGKTRVLVESYTTLLKRPVDRPYDLILLDLDVKSRIDAWELARMRDYLSSDGVLVVNCFIPAEGSRDADHRENIALMSDLLDDVHVFRPTDRNYEYVGLRRRETAGAWPGIEEFIKRIWERLPDYPHKTDIAERIRKSYVGVESSRSVRTERAA